MATWYPPAYEPAYEPIYKPVYPVEYPKSPESSPRSPWIPLVPSTTPAPKAVDELVTEMARFIFARDAL